MSSTWSPERQKQIKMELVINGVADWHQILPAEIDFLHVGLPKMNLDDGLNFIAEANRVSFESTLVGKLVWLGCELLELEVEGCSPDQAGWGKMVWIPDHPSYNEPPQDKFESLLKMNFYRAMFNTEKAGVQHFCLYSTAINGCFHKSLVFHKVVLNPPKPKETQPPA